MEKFYPTKAGIEYAALTAQGKIIEFTKKVNLGTV